MKKTLFAIAAMALAFSANAQLCKSGLLNGYKEGDKLEKSVYESKDASTTLNQWAGAFSSKPAEIESPVIGAALKYPGYPEEGLSIILGAPDGVKGNRFSVYPIDDKKAYSKGVLYLACVVDMQKVASNSPIDLLGLSASGTGASNRAAIKIAREGNNGIKFATNVMKVPAETEMVYDYDKPHLVILKLDYDNQTASLFVDPNVAEEPATPNAVAKGDEENVLKHAIRSISLRNRSGHKGNVGNIRLARTWSDLFAAE